MINEANASSSACRLWRVPRIETGTPPNANVYILAPKLHKVKRGSKTNRQEPMEESTGRLTEPGFAPVQFGKSGLHLGARQIARR